MVQKDLKKVSLILSSSFTAVIEGCINLIPYVAYRQLLNPVGVLLSVFLAVLITHKVKCYSCNLIIKNNEDELKTCIDDNRVEKLKKEIITLKRNKSKLDFF